MIQKIKIWKGNHNYIFYEVLYIMKDKGRLIQLLS